MDHENAIPKKQESNEQKHTEHKKGNRKRKKGDGKKHTPSKTNPIVEIEGRARARTQINNPFEGKKAPISKKETKPIETIGSNRFQDLLSKFDKQKTEGKEAKEDSVPQKLDMSKFCALSSTGTSSSNQPDQTQKPIISNSISQRISLLMESNKNKSNSVAIIDPVLEERKKLREQKGNEEEDEGNISDDDLEISEGDMEEKENEENWDKSESEDEKENKKNEENGHVKSKEATIDDNNDQKKIQNTGHLKEKDGYLEDDEKHEIRKEPKISSKEETLE